MSGWPLLGQQDNGRHGEESHDACGHLKNHPPPEKRREAAHTPRQDDPDEQAPITKPTARPRSAAGASVAA